MTGSIDNINSFLSRESLDKNYPSCNIDILLNRRQTIVYYLYHLFMYTINSKYTYYIFLILILFWKLYKLFIYTYIYILYDIPFIGISI